MMDVTRTLRGMFGDTRDTPVPLPTPPLSVPSPGNVPVALDHHPAHPPLPPHLALRHPVAAAPLAGQEEVTAVSPMPPPAPSRGAQDGTIPLSTSRGSATGSTWESPHPTTGGSPAGRGPQPPRGKGTPPRTAHCHRHSQGLASTAGMAKGPSIRQKGSPERCGEEWDPIATTHRGTGWWVGGGGGGHTQPLSPSPEMGSMMCFDL